MSPAMWEMWCIDSDSSDFYTTFVTVTLLVIFKDDLLGELTVTINFQRLVNSGRSLLDDFRDAFFGITPKVFDPPGDTSVNPSSELLMLFSRF